MGLNIYQISERLSKQKYLHYIVAFTIKSTVEILKIKSPKCHGSTNISSRILIALLDFT
jgi:hypothetical protein